MKNALALDWNDLKYFLAVARSGGLTPAAAELAASPSTVSRHINAMEARLGARLFLRQQSGYQLTDQGSALFEHVAEVERAMLAVERRGGQFGAAEEAAGLVRLAVPETLANSLLAPNLCEFTRAHPRVQVELIAGRTLADLSRREADLALRIVDPKRVEHPPDYIAHRLGIMPFALYGERNLLAAAADWHMLPYISWDESWLHSPRGQWLGTLFPGRQPVLRANTMQAQHAAARSGLGVAMLPCYVGEADPALQRIGDVEAPLERDLWLVYHRDLKASRRVQAMRDFVQALVQRHVLAGHPAG